MIGRQHRFHGLGSLNRVYRQGQTLRSPLVAVKFSPNGRRQHYRAAVVVSRKVHKSAVVRNRIRRRIYEALRQEATQFEGVYDLVFIVFSEQLAELDYTELQKIVRGLLKKAGILASKPSDKSLPNRFH